MFVVPVALAKDLQWIFQSVVDEWSLTTENSTMVE
jgi:hypothetical protein